MIVIVVSLSYRSSVRVDLPQIAIVGSIDVSYLTFGEKDFTSIGNENIELYPTENREDVFR